MRVFFVISVLFLCVSTWGQVPYSKDAVAFVGVNVVPMTSEVVLENQTVLVKDGRIEKIGAVGSFKVPRRAENDTNGRVCGIYWLWVGCFGSAGADPSR